MPKHIVYPLALFEFCFQNLTLSCASVSSRLPQEFYVYVTTVSLKNFVMTMEIFVSFIGDLANLGVSIGRGLIPPNLLVRFPFFSVSLLSARRWGMECFTLAALFRCDRVEFLRCEGSLLGQILGWSVSASPDFSGFPFDYGLLLRSAVYCLC